MAEHTNRTFICSVLFLDIVEYTRQDVSKQIALKERFNAILTEVIAGVATDDRIILDTGDGAAVSFLGDPEDALFAGMNLRDAVAGLENTSSPRLQIRVGLNLGPVRLVKDINGQPNIIGDGINVAQRVMSFAEPGQILVSRSYHDVMARLSEDYAKLFHYEGAKTDKHVREHEVYAIGPAPSNLRRTMPAPQQAARAQGLRLPKLPRLIRSGWGEAFAVNSKLLVAAPLAFTLIVGSGVIARTYRTSNSEAKPPVPTAPQEPRGAATPSADPPPAAPAATSPAAAPPEPASEAPQRLKVPRPAAPPRQSEPQRTARMEAEAPAGAVQTARVKDLEAPVKAKEIATLSRAKEPEPAAPAPVSPRDAVINIVALPWAEVYVDGARHGVSPPLRAIPIKPGRHRIELRNTAFPTYVETVELKSGAEVSVRHRFRR
jgi:class 3 adenylate cyclase